ncbi:hypothetical protein JTT01_20430 [Clostridium botulinum]|nr:hypothetical protein [Clostridium botulinum]MCS4465919.1 hypothetical protein [Clostridium botulinum]
MLIKTKLFIKCLRETIENEDYLTLNPRFAEYLYYFIVVLNGKVKKLMMFHY